MRARTCPVTHLHTSCCAHAAMRLSTTHCWIPLYAQAPRTQAQLHPLVDYILPVFPTINCFSPLRTDTSTATPSAAYNGYFNQVNNKIKQNSISGLVFYAQCAHRQPTSRVCISKRSAELSSTLCAATGTHAWREV